MFRSCIVLRLPQSIAKRIKADSMRTSDSRLRSRETMVHIPTTLNAKLIGSSEQYTNKTNNTSTIT